ncbi:ubiquitin carboxyl-terminal hydrolase 16 isoform X1 [Takifugu rubripes]|uniref:ubiquitin carboxyl-terminal hydrolase 16 isoform X1 n=1 Tax=Takifugu rubripes TaxID=31033 RepID=UPI001145AEB4|nr:ubiquitin carboxyl-terminal hydrolase 16 isoform X1 [Takifugu rubripes]XP_011606954.2 ubiquitin carboxyl-terminal hydrolase 16 isoform X1 [Takifugu rubripes]
MGKKRGKDKSCREEDTDVIGPSCRHIKKGTDQALLKKLSGNSKWTSCQDCKDEENKENNCMEQDCEEEQETPAIWMCLKCGHSGCGRNSDNQHAIKHYETPHSDPHCLVISLDNWSVWCYICNDEVYYSGTGHLAQLVDNLKKQASLYTPNTARKDVKEETSSKEAGQNTEDHGDTAGKDKKINPKKESMKKSQTYGTPDDSSGISVKGLSNLGNTCFFNAVIQNLSQTQLLRQRINAVIKETSLNIEPVACPKLDPLEVQLDKPGPLTFAMCQLLNEIQDSKKSVATPQELFTQVCRKAARFKGFQQQDSQELLRYLLDGMRAEEIKRVNLGIEEALKESKKSNDEEQLKKTLKEYEKNGLPKNLVDYVFGGELTSTIMCQQCKTVSVITEMFLDLSLPVSDEAYRKKNQKKGPKAFESTHSDKSSPASHNEDDVATPGSKYQQKKAKKQAKKQAKHQKRQQKLEGRVTLESLPSLSHPESSQTDFTTDGNNEENQDNEQSRDGSLCEGNPISMSEQELEGFDTHQAIKEQDDDSIIDGDSATPSINRFAILSEDQQTEDVTSGDGKMDVYDGGEDDLVNKMEKVTVDDAIIEDHDALEWAQVVEDEPKEVKEYTVVNQDPKLAFHTFGTRTAPEKQECSVQSCLFQFTEVETLTEKNSLLCVTCTKQQPDKGKGSKNVYTDALKQMLISSLPPVLTLHLKRFQQNGYSICKVNRHVQFPLILDLAPFCGVKCKNVADGEPQILYSLYGIVVHSGTMRSGHYTAYVKVRPEGPKLASNGLAGQADAESPRGKWFHISDTHVQPVSESNVQSCQAYLLFYERVV